MFMGRFPGTTLQWFSGLPDGHITSFDQFSELFREQFSINPGKPPILYDLFSVKLRRGESLKNYLNRLWAFTVKLQTYDEALMVNAFEQGIMAGPFSDSLIRNPTETFVEIRQRDVAHINTEEVVSVKHNTSYPRQTEHKEGSRSRPLRVNETTTEKRTDSRCTPYPTRKNMPKAKAQEDLALRISYKELLSVLGSWKSLSSLGSLTGIWGHERRSDANSTRDLGMMLSDV